MKEIDHNPNERRMTNAVWWVLAAILGLNWAGYLYFEEFDWWPIAIGGGTGIVLALWAIEVTGNKTPKSWGG